MSKSTKIKKIRKPIKPTSPDIESLTQESIKNSNTINLPPLPICDKKYKIIREYINECNPEKEWKEIMEWLKYKPTCLEEAMDMLIAQPDMAIRAKKISLNAKKELEIFILSFKERSGVLKDLAIEYWEKRKKDGMTKQITSEMIEDYIIENYSQVWDEMNMRLHDMKNTEKLLTQLSDQILHRNPDLRKIVDKFSVKNSNPSWFKKGNK